MSPPRLLAAGAAALICGFSAAAQLAIVQATLHQYDGGPPLPRSFRFGRGETVFLRFRVQGYARSPDSRISLACRFDVLDAGGTHLVPPEQKQIQVELAPEDKDWLPVVRYEFLIPPLVDPGSYRILISLEDKLAGRQAGLEIPFEVRGPVVESSSTLVARNFRFLKGEDGPLIEGPAIYSRGEMLWARFEITGYKIGEGNLIEVEYGLAVLGPTGKEVYSEPQAALERSKPFYPHRYVPGLLSLNLEKAQPGAYTLVLRIRDRVGDQRFESRHAFEVR